MYLCVCVCVNSPIRRLLQIANQPRLDSLLFCWRDFRFYYLIKFPQQGGGGYAVDVILGAHYKKVCALWALATAPKKGGQAAMDNKLR